MAEQNENSWFFQNAANFITVVGIIFIIGLWIVAITTPEELWLIIVLVGLISLTDFLDGPVARRLQIISTLGKALDRLRDKLFICSTLPFLAWSYPVSPEQLVMSNAFTTILVFCVIATECLLIYFWIVGVMKRFDVAAQSAGKIKMSCQFVAVVIWLTLVATQKYLVDPPPQALVYLLDLALLVAIIFAIKSAESYHQRYTKS